MDMSFMESSGVTVGGYPQTVHGKTEAFTILAEEARVSTKGG